MEFRRILQIARIITDHILRAKVTQNFLEGFIKRVADGWIEPAAAGIRGESLQGVFPTQIAAGVVGGLAVGAIIGGVIASQQQPYYAPPPAVVYAPPPPYGYGPQY